jgi:hypothetical protein
MVGACFGKEYMDLESAESVAEEVLKIVKLLI